MIRRRRAFAFWCESGQAMVEMALLMPILLTVIFASVFFGIFYKDTSVVLDAARQAARTYAVTQDDGTAQLAAEQTLNHAGIATPSANVQIQGSMSGNWVTYTVSYTDPALPFAFGILPMLERLETVTEQSTFYVE